MNIDYLAAGLPTGPILRITTNKEASIRALMATCDALVTSHSRSVNLKTIVPASARIPDGLHFTRSTTEIGVLIQRDRLIQVHLTPATWADIKDKLSHFLDPNILNAESFSWLAGPQSDNNPTRSGISLLITTYGRW